MFSKCVRLLPTVRRVQYSAVERSRLGCTSSLFIPGDAQSDSYVVITPHIDLADRFKDVKKLLSIVSLRGMDIDVLTIQKNWNKLQEAEKYKLHLEKKLSANVAQSKSLLVSEKQQSEKLKEERLKIQQHLKAANQMVWKLERTAIIQGLRLPNRIHPDTPSENGKVIYESSTKPDRKVNQSHIEIGKKLDLLEYYDSSFYFLKGDASKFELGLSFLFVDSFRDNGFILMSNSDFARSVAVEGVGIDPNDSNSVFILQKESDQPDPNVRLHLVGGASLVSFCTFHAKSVSHFSDLPSRYVTMGKHYSPGDACGHDGLFGSWQNSGAEAFILTSNEEQMMTEFHNLLQKLINVYQSLGYHFRVEYLPPRYLRPWESLHASIQMFSSSMNSYIEVGNVSICDDFISKRLLICCTETTCRPQQFAHVVSSTLVSIPHVLGCVLENCVDEFVVPPQILSKLGIENKI